MDGTGGGGGGGLGGSGMVRNKSFLGMPAGQDPAPRGMEGQSLAPLGGGGGAGAGHWGSGRTPGTGGGGFRTPGTGGVYGGGAGGGGAGAGAWAGSWSIDRTPNNGRIGGGGGGGVGTGPWSGGRTPGTGVDSIYAQTVRSSGGGGGGGGGSGARLLGDFSQAELSEMPVRELKRRYCDVFEEPAPASALATPRWLRARLAAHATVGPNRQFLSRHRSSTRNSSPRFQSCMASYDVVSNICQARGGRHIIDTHVEPSISELHGIV